MVYDATFRWHHAMGGRLVDTENQLLLVALPVPTVAENQFGMVPVASLAWTADRAEELNVSDFGRLSNHPENPLMLGG